MAVLDRAKKAWNAFISEDRTPTTNDYSAGPAVYSSSPPSRPRLRIYNERSIISAIYNRIAIDVASVVYRHVMLDESGRYSDDMDSSFNRCLTLEPNLDQGPRAFRQDVIMTLFDQGVAAIVPVDTAKNPQTSELVDIYTLRVGTICAWYANSVRVSLWNEAKGLRQEVTLDKNAVAIVENPLYSVMNESNSTLQRLIRKLGLLDQVDEATSSGKLDMIIQLPYTIKTESRRQQAEERTKQIEFQLKGSQYGVAYADATEKITQLNRPVENNLLKQIEYLAAMLYGQLGITEEVMNGTADEATMLNYWNRTIEPLVESVVEAMRRSFIGQIGLQKKQDILYFKDPFRLVPVGQLSEIADKFTRNEIFSSNEMRGFMGVPPSKDPKADQLVNSNMPQPGAPVESATPPAADELMGEMDKLMNDTFDDMEKQIEELTKQLEDGDRAGEFIKSFLAHYASEYYDPAKAREYYLRTRELKGRRSGSGLKTENKKQAWAYAKDKITTERDELIKETGNELKADIEIMRTEATRRREQLSGLLKDLLEKATQVRQHDSNVISEQQKKETEKISQLAEKQKEQVSKRAKMEITKLSQMQARMTERISEEASQKIAALPPIPKGISSERRAELAAERSEEIAKIRGTADKQRKTLSDSIKTEKGAVSTEAKMKRDSITKKANDQKEALSKQSTNRRERLSEWSKADKDKNRSRVGSEKTSIRDGLKAAVDKGRAGYKEAKERIKATYEAKLDTEYEAIKNNV